MEVADRADVERAMAVAREGFGPVAVLVNNAGQAESAPFRKTNTRSSSSACWR
jgi:2-hydroxycyclohexanecarboxyl-CoA dehydrogenase